MDERLAELLRKLYGLANYDNLRTAGEVASMTPTPLGDVASGMLAVDDLRKGDYLGAAGNAVGLLPFVPAMGGIVNARKAPAWIDDLLGSGGKLNPDGTVTVFHRTTPGNAKSITESGKMTGKEPALFFTTKKIGGQSDSYGDAIVEFRIPSSKLNLDDLFEDEAHFSVPLRKAGDYLDVSKWIR